MDAVGIEPTTCRLRAIEAERKRRRELEEGFNGIDSRAKKERVSTVATASAVYLKEYRLKHRVTRFADYGVQHLCQHLGSMMLGAISDSVINDYQLARLEEKAAPATTN